ncbi:mitochondrial fission protein ELM1-like isoform X1 [Senna tora]|uniref:Mitochondrial fission protein ELM1-like isoform X1 n=1 Tax=Senna tora TaxID=362788 RepID=A0A834SNW3_9FABA|nr:mitochondrial fission protein ELM1-like isoform X1 [Senna tora]
MRPIRLPEPPSGYSGMPEIFNGGVHGAIRRAVVIGNGFAGAENQSFGLVRALGLLNRLSIYRVTRPRGGISEWLHWLPVSIHKKLDNIVRRLCGNARYESNELGLSNVFEPDARRIAKWARESFEKDGPLLVVASGRDTISVASSIKRLAPENVFVVQVGDVMFSLRNHRMLKIQHPRFDLNRFDLVITPRHDYYPLTADAQRQIPWFLRRWVTPREPPGRNVVLTVGALHQADTTSLRIAASDWDAELTPLPKPLLVVETEKVPWSRPKSLIPCKMKPQNYSRTSFVAVAVVCTLIFESSLCIIPYDLIFSLSLSGNCPYGEDLAKQLAAMLQNVLWSCGTVRISFSRRTPEKISKFLVREFSTNPKVEIWDGEGPNPHMGHLAWGEAFVVTADSVSMLSEACSTGKPVYVIGAERCTWKFADFQRRLQELGVARPFTGKEDMTDSWSYPPLNDTAEAANQVVTALAQRGWTIRTESPEPF